MKATVLKANVKELSRKQFEAFMRQEGFPGGLSYDRWYDDSIGESFWVARTIQEVKPMDKALSLILD